MKFLMDMNLPRSLGPLLTRAGFAARHAGDSGLATAQDPEIIRAAFVAGEVILTHDLDFGHLLAFSGASHPSVVIFRQHEIRAAALHERLMKSWIEIERPLAEGAIVIIEDAVLRVRRLPIERES